MKVRVHVSHVDPGPEIPEQLVEILDGFINRYLLVQPDNCVLFAAEYFSKEYERRLMDQLISMCSLL
jgi:hypothetical protein